MKRYPDNLENIRKFSPDNFQFSQKKFNLSGNFSINLDKFQLSQNFRINLGYPKNRSNFILSDMDTANVKRIDNSVSIRTYLAI